MSLSATNQFDVVVVGSGPNGLAAAITAARAGRSVVVLEAGPEVGGACRSEELTLPGFVHDVGSAIHPLSVASPFMTTIPWADHGVRWVTPPAAMAHPLDGGDGAVVWNDLDRTVEGLGADGAAYRRLFGPLVERFDELIELSLNPPLQALSRPFDAVRLGPRLLPPATWLARLFEGDRARAIVAGHAAHSILPLNRPLTAAFCLLLGSAAHRVGWPFPAGGAGEITRALRSELEGLGGIVETDHPVRSPADLPRCDAAIFALGPHQIASIASGSGAGGSGSNGGGRRPDGPSGSMLGRLRRFRYGPGACKIDLAVSEPIPWANPDMGQAGTVHVGGRFEEVAEAEATVAAGHHARRPFVLVAQHTPFDPERAPNDQHTVWAYCHVPNGSTLDVSGTIVAQIERFAPGFRDTILHTTVSRPADLERRNANLVGGDVGGGSYRRAMTLFRPWVTADPYRLGRTRWYLASASASPGGGVHGMAGHLAAMRALRDG